MSLIKKRLKIKGYLTSTWARSKFVCERILTINPVYEKSGSAYSILIAE